MTIFRLNKSIERSSFLNDIIWFIEWIWKYWKLEHGYLTPLRWAERIKPLEQTSKNNKNVRKPDLMKTYWPHAALIYWVILHIKQKEVVFIWNYVDNLIFLDHEFVSSLHLSSFVHIIITEYLDQKCPHFLSILSPNKVRRFATFIFHKYKQKIVFIILFFIFYLGIWGF
jgi:hypothetical protein